MHSGDGIVPSAMPAPRVPNGYFESNSGAHRPPRVRQRLVPGANVLHTSEAVMAGDVLWEEDCSCVFGRFDARRRVDSSTTDRHNVFGLIRACPQALVHALLSSKGNGGAVAARHPIEQWLCGFDLLQRLVCSRAELLIRGLATEAPFGCAELLVPPAPLTHSVSPYRERLTLPDVFPNIEAAKVPLGIGAMLLQGLSRVLPSQPLADASTPVGHALPTSVCTDEDAALILQLGQVRRILLCRGVVEDASGNGGGWDAYALFPFSCAAAVVTLRDAANADLIPVVDPVSGALRVRCVATDGMAPGATVRVFVPRDGLLCDANPCLPPGTFRPGGIMELYRARILADTKPWSAEVAEQLTSIDARLKSALRQR